MSLEEQLEMQGFETKSLNGRPLGTADFIAMVEQKLGRSLRRGKPGPKARGQGGYEIG